MGQRVDALTPNDLVKLGVIQVMEGRHCFEHLTVEENLLTGAYTRKGPRAEIERDLEKVYGYFPQLKDRRKDPQVDSGWQCSEENSIYKIVYSGLFEGSQKGP